MNQLPELGITFDAEVVRVLDGDTVEVETRIRHTIRLQDCWAQETTLRNGTTPEEKAQGLDAKAFLMNLLQRSRNRVRVWIPGNGGDLKKVTSMSRLIGRMWPKGDDVDISQRMIEAGHATATKEG